METHFLITDRNKIHNSNTNNCQ
uniref:Uncharacterized protein n=1 Tax=Rhizophora mucronata TaxID=61149 RepID=A0A2P2PEZ6_RHIMU